MRIKQVGITVNNLQRLIECSALLFMTPLNIATDNIHSVNVATLAKQFGFFAKTLRIINRPQVIMAIFDWPEMAILNGVHCNM